MLEIEEYGRGRCVRCGDGDTRLGVRIRRDGRAEFVCKEHLWELVRAASGGVREDRRVPDET